MNTFLSSYTEQEFKEFLKGAIREVLSEDQNQLQPAQPEILTIAEASEFLRLKINTLYEKTSRKLIPHFKKGKVKTSAELDGEAAVYLLNGSRKGQKRNAA